MKLIPLDGGRQFTLETPSGDSITISELELVGIAQLVLPYLDQLKARRQGAPIYAVPTTTPIDVHLSLDAHHTEAVIRFEEQNGLENAYVLNPDFIRKLRDGCDRKLQQIEDAKRKRGTPS